MYSTEPIEGHKVFNFIIVSGEHDYSSNYSPDFLILLLSDTSSWFWSYRYYWPVAIP